MKRVQIQSFMVQFHGSKYPVLSLNTGKYGIEKSSCSGFGNHWNWGNKKFHLKWKLTKRLKFYWLVKSFKNLANVLIDFGGIVSFFKETFLIFTDFHKNYLMQNDCLSFSQKDKSTISNHFVFLTHFTSDLIEMQYNLLTKGIYKRLRIWNIADMEVFT